MINVSQSCNADDRRRCKQDNNMKIFYFIEFIEMVENKLVKVDEVYDMRLLFQS